MIVLNIAAIKLQLIESRQQAANDAMYTGHPPSRNMHISHSINIGIR